MRVETSRLAAIRREIAMLEVGREMYRPLIIVARDGQQSGKWT